MTHCTKLGLCLACGGNELIPTLDLGTQPLANNFRFSRDKTDELAFPLAVNRCGACDHLQLSHAVDPEIIYKNYLYVSGTSKTYTDYMKWYAGYVCETQGALGTVLDIGCNDGSQLDAFRTLGYTTYGIDPAENLYPISSKNHSVTMGYWNAAAAQEFALTGQQFDVITSQNAFSHIPDPLAYLQAVTLVLQDRGLMFISTSQADMIQNGEFDTIYHEHISYYNVYSMKCLAERAGLYLVDVVKTPIHGTSYIFVLSKQNRNPARIANICAMELVLHQDPTYSIWASEVNQLLVDIKRQVDTARDQGYKIVGYGAAAKGMTLLNATGAQLDAVIDDNPLKQGTYCPGTTIPVVGVELLDAVDPDDSILFIPLAWNFYQEIKTKIQNRRHNETDKFMKYFPKITIE